MTVEHAVYDCGVACNIMVDLPAQGEMIWVLDGKRSSIDQAAQYKL
jgi:hypothetical protein